MKRLKIGIMSLSFLITGIGLFLYVPSQAADEAPRLTTKFFCGVNPEANNGFAVSSDKLCGDDKNAKTAAAVDKDGFIQCFFATSCVPLSDDILKSASQAAGKDYGQMTTAERFRVLAVLSQGLNLPHANVTCKVRSFPCQPNCGSVQDCADPAKGGEVHFLKALPGSPLDQPQGIETTIQRKTTD